MANTKAWDAKLTRISESGEASKCGDTRGLLKSNWGALFGQKQASIAIIHNTLNNTKKFFYDNFLKLGDGDRACSPSTYMRGQRIRIFVLPINKNKIYRIRDLFRQEN